MCFFLEHKEKQKLKVDSIEFLNFYSFFGALNFEIPEKLQDLPYL